MSLAQVRKQAIKLFEGDARGAKQWLHQPNRALAGKTPAEAAETAQGTREVEKLIGRLEHGVFS